MKDGKRHGSEGHKYLHILLLSLLTFIPAVVSSMESTESRGGLLCEADNAPQRIISLVPAITEELYLLGVGDRIVGNTVYCQRPPRAQYKEKVGTVIDANVEKIIELSPDLVIASPLSGRRQTRKLQRLAINVEVFDEAVDFKGLCENFL
ncbi:MAG: ABC transporter substrate-binding protein, partial [Deltaproteobacteria bacterium]|nr:ABC transporter substrate-binding protein [Deltaproteobacteria bacterium]